ncbi:MAG: uncharacterized protein QOE13_3035 [Gaiellaceae bacterium]|jgi:uncharacterized protein YciI|nr:uncharacterized protein [Gaiellaceae bacterium]
MTGYFLVKRVPGPEWDHSRLRRSQEGWDEHAAFMDKLVEQGLIVLGGPVGEGDGDYALQVFDAENAEAVLACLADDPWEDAILRTESVEPWSIWLQRARG